jgi:hypothetical protein
MAADNMFGSNGLPLSLPEAPQASQVRVPAQIVIIPLPIRELNDEENRAFFSRKRKRIAEIQENASKYNKMKADLEESNRLLVLRNAEIAELKAELKSMREEDSMYEAEVIAAGRALCDGRTKVRYLRNNDFFIGNVSN